MMNKTRVFWPLAAAALLLAACAQPSFLGDEVIPFAHMSKALAQPAELPPEPCGTPLALNLYAGQDIAVGTVTVFNDTVNLYVHLQTTADWLIYEAHLAVGTELEDLLHKGSPVPGRFPYQQDLNDAPADSVLFAVRLEDWGPGTELYLAAHAAVKLLDADGQPVQSETAWGDGEALPGGNWATYFRYVVQGCDDPPPVLPWLFRTQTQGGWGAPAHGNNPGVYRDAHFAAVFPAGLFIGRQDGTEGFRALFTTAEAVELFLPAGGKPAALDRDYQDPLASSAGVLAGQVLALSLSVGFDAFDADFSPSDVLLADLLVSDPSSPCHGWTVGQLLYEANRILAGLAPESDAGLTPAQIADCVALVNENFVDGTTDGGFLEAPTP